MLPYPKITQQGCAETKIKEHWEHDMGLYIMTPLKKFPTHFSLKAVDTIGNYSK